MAAVEISGLMFGLLIGLALYVAFLPRLSIEGASSPRGLAHRFDVMISDGIGLCGGFLGPGRVFFTPWPSLPCAATI